MNKLYWLASYPKSGNTWVRALLSYYQMQQNASINNLQGGSLHLLRNQFDDWLGLESSDLTLDEINIYRHYYHLQLASQIDSNSVVKVHDAYCQTDENKLLYPEKITAGALYIVRNPLDVAASYAHHENCSIDNIIKKMNQSDALLIKDKEHMTLALQQKLLSWSKHAQSWLQCPNCKVVRYEDLLDSPQDKLREILLFFKYQIDEEKIAQAVEAANFNNLKKQEKSLGFNERHARAQSFFRSGKSGGWKNELNPQQIKTIRENHHEMMTYFNYS